MGGLFDFNLYIGSRKLDVYSIYLFTFMGVVWFSLWKISKFYLFHSKVVNSIYISMYVVLLFNAFWSDDTSANYEREEQKLDSLHSTIQSVAIATLGLGLFISTSSRFKSAVSIKDTMIVLQFALFCAFISLIYISVPKEGAWVRYLRKTKQILLNFSIFYFLMAIYLITTN